MAARVFVTGAGGRVGMRLVRLLAARGHAVTAGRRAGPEGVHDGIDWRSHGDIGADPDWPVLVAGMDGIVHLAAHTPARGGTAADFHRVNVTATEALARAASAAGVRRLVHVGSVGVLAVDPADPDAAGPYRASKWRAEQRLRAVVVETGLAVAVLRPPAVYGPGVPSKLARLARLVDTGLPLPLGGIANRRSHIFVDNLLDAIALCLEHPAASGGTFAVTDGPPVSTTELVRRVAAALGRRPLLLPCPVAMLRSVGRLLGRIEAIESLVGDFAVDDAAIRERLGWSPPVPFDTALALTLASPAS